MYVTEDNKQCALLPILEFSNSCTRGGVVIAGDGNCKSSSSSISSISSFLPNFDVGVEGGDDLMASTAHT